MDPWGNLEMKQQTSWRIGEDRPNPHELGTKLNWKVTPWNSLGTLDGGDFPGNPKKVEIPLGTPLLEIHYCSAAGLSSTYPDYAG